MVTRVRENDYMSDNNKKPIIAIDKVSKHFGGIIAVNEISLEIYPGSIVAIVGDNGAGKSTLIKMISGVYPVDSGKIYFEGTDVTNRSAKEMRNLGIETIYQDLALASNLDSSSNIFLGREPVRNRFFNIIDRKYMREASIKKINEVGFNIPNIRRRVRDLSGGQQQGIAILRAIFWSKKVIIMDEPTAALGVKESEKVMNLIRETIKHVKSIIIIAHNIDHVIKLASRAIVLKNARKVKDISFSDYNGRSTELHNDIVKAITGLEC